MRRVLQIIPYNSLYPPNNGGKLRSFHLMDQISRFSKLDVLTYQTENEIIQKGYTNENIRFFSPHSFIQNQRDDFLQYYLYNSIRYRWVRRSFDGPANIVVLDFEKLLKHLAQTEKYTTVIFEHIASMLLAPIVKRLFPNAKLILDAHNVDYKLEGNEKLRRKIKKTEESIYKNVDEFWACSQEDVEELEAMNNKRINGILIPNGVDTFHKSFHKNKVGLAKSLLFCGSLNYYPNQEGLLWFFDEIWSLVTKKIKDVRLTIIGRGDTAPFKHFENDERVSLIGEVENVAEYYKNNYIAIIPLLSGSGTRLKILEAMSFGNPIVSTSIGIEGINVKDRQEVLIADNPDSFANAIIEIIQKPELGEFLRVNAYQLVKTTYDWNIIGEILDNSLQYD